MLAINIDNMQNIPPLKYKAPLSEGKKAQQQLNSSARSSHFQEGWNILDII